MGGGKGEARQGFGGLGLEGVSPGAQEGKSPLAYPPSPADGLCGAAKNVVDVSQVVRYT